MDLPVLGEKWVPYPTAAALKIVLRTKHQVCFMNIYREMRRFWVHSRFRLLWSPVNITKVYSVVSADLVLGLLANN